MTLVHFNAHLLVYPMCHSAPQNTCSSLEGVEQRGCPGFGGELQPQEMLRVTHFLSQLQQRVYPVFLWPCCYCKVASVMYNSARRHRRQPTRLPRLNTKEQLLNPISTIWTPPDIYCCIKSLHHGDLRQETSFIWLINLGANWAQLGPSHWRLSYACSPRAAGAEIWLRSSRKHLTQAECLGWGFKPLGAGTAGFLRHLSSPHLPFPSLIPSPTSTSPLLPHFCSHLPWRLRMALRQSRWEVDQLWAAIPRLFGTREGLRGRQFFHRAGWEVWFQDDSNLPRRGRSTCRTRPARPCLLAGLPPAEAAAGDRVRGAGRGRAAARCVFRERLLCTSFLLHLKFILHPRCDSVC